MVQKQLILNRPCTVHPTNDHDYLPLCECVNMKRKRKKSSTDESPLPQQAIMIQCNVYMRNYSGGPHSALFEDTFFVPAAVCKGTIISNRKYEMFLMITDCKQLLSGTQLHQAQANCRRWFTTVQCGSKVMKRT